MANPLDPSVDPVLARPATVLCGLRPWGGSLSDVVVQDGVITGVRPAEQRCLSLLVLGMHCSARPADSLICRSWSECS